jgi:hypothetical protein
LFWTVGALPRHFSLLPPQPSRKALSLRYLFLLSIASASIDSRNPSCFVPSAMPVRTNSARFYSGKYHCFWYLSLITPALIALSSQSAASAAAAVMFLSLAEFWFLSLILRPLRDFALLLVFLFPNLRRVQRLAAAS